MATRHRASLASFIALAAALGGCSLGASTSAAVAGTPEARSDPGAPGAVQAAEPFAVGSGGLGSPGTLDPATASAGFRGATLGGVETPVSITSAVGA